ncbi:hypothetical protein SAMN02910369_02347 [Lachnospiraceae bacterium NE2001]|nr:hypothetical protein SAMN02910369_02347 [Lachnospiraceae bacterium NE2001]
MIEKRSNTGGQAEGIIADISTKSFTKRPALQQGPLVSILNFMNNAVFVNNKPGNIYKCDAALLMLVKSSFRWVISGTSRVLYFANKKLVAESEKKEYPRIGIQPTYTPELSEIRKVEKGENAFFLCSKSLTDAIGSEGIEKALQDATSQDDWMRRVEEMAGDTDFAAQALILPEQRRAPILSIAIIALLVILIILVIILILK